MSRRHSRAEAEMDARLDELDPESERFKVLVAARRFKASWVELGQNLTVAREQGSFKKWGFATFEAYCRRELRIKQDTANKLTRSFAFLRDHEPEVLSGGGDDEAARQLPSLDVVDLLSQARERTKVSDDDLAALQEEAFASEATATRQGLLKKLREHDPEAFKPVQKEAPAQKAPGENDMRKALLLAERLESLLAAQGENVSQETIRHAHSLVADLRERFERGHRQGAA